MPGYRYRIEIYPAEGSGWSIRHDDPDFQPVLEWCQFEALRAGHLPIAGNAIIEPVFAGDGPAVSAFRVTVPAEGIDFHAEIPYGCLAPAAGRFRSALAKAGKIAEDAACHWVLSAWKSDDGAGAPLRAAGLSVNPVAGSLAHFLERSAPNRPDDGAHVKTFVPRDVIEETAGLAAASAPLECGGILLGRLCRDNASGELFQVITAFVPAPGAVASETELRFTPETWRAVREAVKLRGGDEIWCGWVHSHTPASWGDKCGRCPAEKQRTCSLATALFSEQDRSLHRQFRAFSIALVANVLSDGVVHSCFGWKQGVIELRPFHILENPQ